MCSRIPTNCFGEASAGRIFDVQGRVHRATPCLHPALKASLSRLFESDSYPCLGAKSVFNSGLLRVGIYAALGSTKSVEESSDDLIQFVEDYLSKTDAQQRRFASFIAIFRSENVRSERAFHYRIWYHLTMMRYREKQWYPWSRLVDERTNSTRFAFSHRECALFVIGTYPSHPRIARRLPWPALVFNPHQQFLELRARGKYESMKAKIRAREARMQAESNLFLADHGTVSEAKQYSGIVSNPPLYIPSWN